MKQLNEFINEKLHISQYLKDKDNNIYVYINKYGNDDYQTFFILDKDERLTNFVKFIYRETLPNPRPSKEYDEAVEDIVNEIRSGKDRDYLNFNDFIDKLFDELEKDKHGRGVEPTELL